VRGDGGDFTIVELTSGLFGGCSSSAAGVTCASGRAGVPEIPNPVSLVVGGGGGWLASGGPAFGVKSDVKLKLDTAGFRLEPKIGITCGRRFDGELLRRGLPLSSAMSLSRRGCGGRSKRSVENRRTGVDVVAIVMVYAWNVGRHKGAMVWSKTCAKWSSEG